MRQFLLLLLLLLFTVPLAAQVTVTSNPNLAIPDNNAYGVSDTINVSPTTDRIYSLRVGVRITHTYDADLSIWLLPPGVTWAGPYATVSNGPTVSPGSGAIELTTKNGGGGNDYGSGTTPTIVYTNFTSGSDPLNPATTSITAGGAPFTSQTRWIPEGVAAWDLLFGGNPSGNWTLIVVDAWGQDTGTLDSWQLEYSTTPSGTISVGRGANNAPGATIQPNAANQVAGQLDFKAGSAITLSSVTLQAENGVALSGSFSRVALHQDLNGNGQLDVGDTEVFSGTVSGSSNITLTAAPAVAFATGETRSFMVVVDSVAVPAALGVAFRIVSATDLNSSGTPFGSFPLPLGYHHFGPVRSAGSAPIGGRVIRDNFSTGTSDTITIPATAELIGSLRVGIRIDHNFDQDLDIYLIPPSGPSIELSTDNGGNNNDYGSGAANGPYVYTFFSGDTDPLFATGTNINGSTAPFTGAAAYRPEGLTNWNGLYNTNPSGGWTLWIVDDNGQGGDETLHSWYIEWAPAPPQLNIDRGAANAPGTTIQPGVTDQVAGQISFSATGALDLTSVTLQAENGVSLSGSFSRVALHQDLNGNGLLDAGDTEVFSGSVGAGSSITLTDAAPVTYGTGETRYYLVVVDAVANPAALGVAFRIAAASDVSSTGIESGSFPLALGYHHFGPVHSWGSAPIGGLAIPDNNPGGVTDTITIPATLDRIGSFRVGVRIGHLRDSDLDIYLQPPFGPPIDLSTDNGGNGDDYGTGAANGPYVYTYFTGSIDPLYTSAAAITSGGPPYANANGYLPEGIVDWDNLYGADPTGGWTLNVADDRGGTTGTLISWYIEYHALGRCELAGAANFGSSIVGVTSGASPQGFSVTNPGELDLTITNIGFAGANPADFALNPAIVFPVVVPAGAVFNFGVNFTPGGAGARSADLQVTSDHNGVPNTVTTLALSGTGLPPAEIDVQRPAASSIADGAPDPVGGTFVGVAAPFTYTVQNVGSGGTINVGAISVIGPLNCGVVITPPGVTALGAGVSTTFQVNITAVAPGPFSFTLSIVNDDTDENPYEILVSGTAVNPPQLSAASPVAYGSSNVGVSSAPVGHVISNTGGAALTITSISIVGANAGDWGLVAPPATPVVIAAGGNLPLQGIFTPSATGARSAQLRLVSDSGAVPGTVTLIDLSGTGTLATIGVTSPVNYGSSNVGVAAPSQNHVVNNTGTGPMTVTAISVGGDWTLTNLPALPAVVAAGGNFNFDGIFTPTATGARNATIQVSWNQGGGVGATVTNISVAGSGTFGALGVTTPVNHGSSNLGVSTASFPHALNNTGTGPIQITAITLAGTNPGDWAFSPLPSLPAVVNPGGNLNISTIFTPLATGARSALVNVTWNQGAGSTITPITLDGTGTQASIGVTTPVNYGSSNVGVPASSQNHVVNNTGSGPMTVTAISVGGDWTLTNLPALPLIVAAGGNFSFDGIFTPTATGARNATIQVSWNQGGGVGATITDINVTGNGTQATIGVTTPVNYGSSNVGVSTAPVNHTVNNTGSGPMTVTAISVGGDWTLTNLPALPLVVAAGGNFNFDGIFTPTATGARNATIQVSWNQGGGVGPTITDINVTGNGTQASIGVTTPVNYGSSNVGVSTAPVNHTVNNTGSGPMTVTAISVGGDWTLTNLPALPLVVAAGGNFNFDGIFTPTATGARNATIQVSWNQGSGVGATVTDINVTGNGTLASIGVTTPVNYGSSNVGVAAPSQNHVVNNMGTGPMTVTAISVGGDWTLTNLPALPLIVAAGGNFNFDGIFTPTATGARNATIQVSWNQGGGVGATITDINLTGNGTYGDISVPVSYDHGGVLVGSGSPRTHRIDSVGTGPARVLSVSLAGADAAFWSLSVLPPANHVLAAGVFWDFDSLFTPNAARLFTAQIVVNWDEGAGTLAQQSIINVSGTGGLGSIVTNVTVGPDDGGPVRVQGDVSGPPASVVDVAVTYSGGSNPGSAVISSAPGYTIVGNVIQAVPVGSTLVFYWDAYATEGHTTASDYVVTLSPSIGGFPGTPGSSAMFTLTRQGGWTKTTAIADIAGTVTEHAMIRDVANDRLIVFGGYRGGVLSNETWAFNNATATWRKLSTSGTAPSPRREVLAVYDAAANRMIVFGGQAAGGYTNDTFALDLTPGAESWSQVAQGSPATPSPRTHGTLVVDTSNNRALLYGGYTSPKVHLDVWALSLTPGSESWGSGPLTTVNGPLTQSIGNASIYDPVGQRMLVYRAFTAELYELSLGVTPTWTNLTPAGTPSARRYPAVAYDSSRHAMILQGGLVGTATLTETWSLDIASMTWNQLPDEPNSSGRFWHAAAYDESRDHFVMLGGRDGARVPNQTLAVLDLGVPSWIPSPAAVSDAAGPEGRIGAVMCNDAANNRVVLFGGQTLSGMVNDLWVLDRNAPGPWTRLSVAGSSPAPRAFAAASYDAANQRMIVFGGQGGSGRLDDVWTLDLSGSPAWTQWSSAGGPAARSLSAAAYNPGTNRLQVFGGQAATQLNDFWEYDFGTSSWSQPATSGTPPAARIGHGAVYDSVNNRFVVFCGTVGNVEVRDVWALDLSLPTPAWSDISAVGTAPTQRARFAMGATPAGNSVYIHGGKYAYHQLGDTWRLDLSGALASWTQIAAYTGAPTVRLEHAGCLDNAGRFVMGTGKYVFKLCNDAWEIDPGLPSPAWSQLAVPSTPPNLAYAQSAYDPVGNRMIVFSGLVNGAHHSGLWQLDLAANPPAWSMLSAAGTPPAPRSGTSFVYDGAHSPPRMLMYGGRAGTSAATYLAELWALELTPGAEQWVQLSPSGAFTWRGYHSAVVDGSGGMVVFGGTDRYGGASAIIQRMDLNTLVWSNLSTTGTGPAARYWHGAIYDGGGGRNRMLVYGGKGASYYNDLWELNLTTLAWTQLASSGAAPSAWMSAVHDVAGERMLVFGGNDPQAKADFFALDLSADSWSQISPAGSTPQARWGHTAVWDSVRSRMVVVGGLTGKADGGGGEIPLTQDAGAVVDTWFWGD